MFISIFDNYIWVEICEYMAHIYGDEKLLRVL